MSTISSWLLSIAGVVILGVLSEFLLPEGQINRHAKFIFSLITLLVIIMPLPSIFGKNFDISKYFSDSNYPQENYLEQINLDKLNALTESVNTDIEESGILNVTVSINGSILEKNLEIYSVSVNIGEMEYAAGFEDYNITSAKAKILEIIRSFSYLENVEVNFDE